MKKLFFVFANLILFLLGIYAIHDMQTAQGVGYYFAIRLGKDRLLFDIIVDLIFVIFLIIAMFLPFIVMHSKMAFAYSRFFILFVALVPSLRTDYVFTLFFSVKSLFIKFSFDTWATQIMNAFWIIVPLLILTIGFSTVVLKEKLSRRNKVIFIVTAVLLLLSILAPGFAELLLFVGAYLLIFVIFNILETNDFDSLWLYCFLFAVAIYRIITVTAAW